MSAQPRATDGKAAHKIVPPRPRCYGAAARILHSIVADVNRWSNPMQKLNDLSRSLTALEPDGTLIAVIEMRPVELARCRYRAWHRAPAVEEPAVDESALLKLLPRRAD